MIENDDIHAWDWRGYYEMEVISGLSASVIQFSHATEWRSTPIIELLGFKLQSIPSKHETLNNCWFNAHDILRTVSKAPKFMSRVYCFPHSCCWLSLRDVWRDQPISHSLLYASLHSLILLFRGNIHTSTARCQDGLISALVTTSNPRLKARAWCGDLCWDEPISPSQRCRMHIQCLRRSNW